MKDIEDWVGMGVSNIRLFPLLVYPAMRKWSQILASLLIGF